MGTQKKMRIFSSIILLGQVIAQWRQIYPVNSNGVIKIGCDCPDNGPRLRGLEQKLKDLENRLRQIDARKPKRGPPGDAGPMGQPGPRGYMGTPGVPGKNGKRGYP